MPNKCQALSLSPTQTQDAGEHVDKGINVIFEYTIFLNYEQRAGGKDTEEGERNSTTLHELWVRDMNMYDWIVKNFHIAKDIMTGYYNIAYTHIRCEGVSDETRNILGKTKQNMKLEEFCIWRLCEKDKEGTLSIIV